MLQRAGTVALAVWVTGLPFCFILYRFRQLQCIHRLHPRRLALVYAAFGLYAAHIYFLGRRILQAVGPISGLASSTETTSDVQQQPQLFSEADDGFTTSAAAEVGIHLPAGYRYVEEGIAKIVQCLLNISLRDVSFSGLWHGLVDRLLRPLLSHTQATLHCFFDSNWWAANSRVSLKVIAAALSTWPTEPVWERVAWWTLDEAPVCITSSLTQAMTATLSYGLFCVHVNAMWLRGTAAVARESRRKVAQLIVEGSEAAAAAVAGEHHSNGGNYPLFSGSEFGGIGNASQLLALDAHSCSHSTPIGGGPTRRARGPYGHAAARPRGSVDSGNGAAGGANSSGPSDRPRLPPGQHQQQSTASSSRASVRASVSASGSLWGNDGLVADAFDETLRAGGVSGDPDAGEDTVSLPRSFPPALTPEASRVLPERPIVHESLANALYSYTSGGGGRTSGALGGVGGQRSGSNSSGRPHRVQRSDISQVYRLPVWTVLTLAAFPFSIISAVQLTGVALSRALYLHYTPSAPTAMTVSTSGNRLAASAQAIFCPPMLGAASSVGLGLLLVEYFALRRYKHQRLLHRAAPGAAFAEENDADGVMLNNRSNSGAASLPPVLPFADVGTSPPLPTPSPWVAVCGEAGVRGEVPLAAPASPLLRKIAAIDMDTTAVPPVVGVVATAADSDGAPSAIDGGVARLSSSGSATPCLHHVTTSQPQQRQRQRQRHHEQHYQQRPLVRRHESSWVPTDVFGPIKRPERDIGAVPHPIFHHAFMVAGSHLVVALFPRCLPLWCVAVLTAAAAGPWSMAYFLAQPIHWIATEYSQLCGRSAWRVFFSPSFVPFDLEKDERQLNAEDRAEDEAGGQLADRLLGDPPTAATTVAAVAVAAAAAAVKATGDAGVGSSPNGVVIDLDSLHSAGSLDDIVSAAAAVGAAVAINGVVTGGGSMVGAEPVLTGSSSGERTSSAPVPLPAHVMASTMAPQMNTTRLWTSIAARVRREWARRGGGHRHHEAADAAAGVHGGIYRREANDDGDGHATGPAVTPIAAAPTLTSSYPPPRPVDASALLPFPDGIPQMSVIGTSAGFRASDLSGSILLHAPQAACLPSVVEESRRSGDGGTGSSSSSAITSGDASRSHSRCSSSTETNSMCASKVAVAGRASIGTGPLHDESHDRKHFRSSQREAADPTIEDFGAVIVVDTDGNRMILNAGNNNNNNNINTNTSSGHPSGSSGVGIDSHASSSTAALGASGCGDVSSGPLNLSFCAQLPSRLARELMEERESFARFIAAIDADGDNTSLLQRLLCGHGKNLVEQRDEQGCTALHHATLGGYARGIQFLVGLGADPNALNDEGEAPLHVAVKELASISRRRLLRQQQQQLLNHGQDQGATATTATATIPSPDDQAEFPRGVRVTGRRHATPLSTDTAIHHSLTSTARVGRLSRGKEGTRTVSTTPWGPGASNLIPRRQLRSVVVALIECGADANMPTRVLGLTPLHYAVIRGEVGVINTLLRAGADPLQFLCEGPAMTPAVPVPVNVSSHHDPTQDLASAAGGGNGSGNAPVCKEPCMLSWAEAHISFAGVASSTVFRKSPVMLAVELNADVVTASLLYAILCKRERERGEVEFIADEEEGFGDGEVGGCTAQAMEGDAAEAGTLASSRAGDSKIATPDPADSTSLYSLLLPRCEDHQLSLLQVALALGHAATVCALLQLMNEHSESPATITARRPHGRRRRCHAQHPCRLAHASCGVMSNMNNSESHEDAAATADVPGRLLTRRNPTTATAPPTPTATRHRGRPQHRPRVRHTRDYTRRQWRMMAAGVVPTSKSRTRRFACARELQCEHERKTVFHFAALGDSTEALAHLLEIGFRVPDYVPPNSSYVLADTAWRARRPADPREAAAALNDFTVTRNSPGSGSGGGGKGTDAVRTPPLQELPVLDGNHDDDDDFVSEADADGNGVDVSNHIHSSNGTHKHNSNGDNHANKDCMSDTVTRNTREWVDSTQAVPTAMTDSSSIRLSTSSASVSGYGIGGGGGGGGGASGERANTPGSSQSTGTRGTRNCNIHINSGPSVISPVSGALAASSRSQPHNGTRRQRRQQLLIRDVVQLIAQRSNMDSRGRGVGTGASLRRAWPCADPLTASTTITKAMSIPPLSPLTGSRGRSLTVARTSAQHAWTGTGVGLKGATHSIGHTRVLRYGAVHVGGGNRVSSPRTETSAPLASAAVMGTSTTSVTGGAAVTVGARVTTAPASNVGQNVSHIENSAECQKDSQLQLMSNLSLDLPMSQFSEGGSSLHTRLTSNALRGASVLTTTAMTHAAAALPPTPSMTFSEAVVKLRQRAVGVPIDYAHLDQLENAVDAVCLSSALTDNERRSTQLALLVVTQRLTMLEEAERVYEGSSLMAAAGPPPQLPSVTTTTTASVAIPTSAAGRAGAVSPFSCADLETETRTENALVSTTVPGSVRAGDDDSCGATTRGQTAQAGRAGGGVTGGVGGSVTSPTTMTSESESTAELPLLSATLSYGVRQGTSNSSSSGGFGTENSGDLLGTAQPQHEQHNEQGPPQPSQHTSAPMFIDVANKDVVLAYIAVCLNQCDVRGMTPLHYAIVNRNANMVFVLCVYGARFVFANRETQLALTAPTTMDGAVVSCGASAHGLETGSPSTRVPWQRNGFGDAGGSASGLSRATPPTSPITATNANTAATGMAVLAPCVPTSAKVTESLSPRSTPVVSRHGSSDAVAAMTQAMCGGVTPPATGPTDHATTRKPQMPLHVPDSSPTAATAAYTGEGPLTPPTCTESNPSAISGAGRPLGAQIRNVSSMADPPAVAVLERAAEGFLEQHDPMVQDALAVAATTENAAQFLVALPPVDHEQQRKAPLVGASLLTVAGLPPSPSVSSPHSSIADGGDSPGRMTSGIGSSFATTAAPAAVTPAAASTIGAATQTRTSTTANLDVHEDQLSTPPSASLSFSAHTTGTATPSWTGARVTTADAAMMTAKLVVAMLAADAKETTITIGASQEEQAVEQAHGSGAQPPQVGVQATTDGTASAALPEHEEAAVAQTRVCVGVAVEDSLRAATAAMVNGATGDNSDGITGVVGNDGGSGLLPLAFPVSPASPAPAQSDGSVSSPPVSLSRSGKPISTISATPDRSMTAVDTVDDGAIPPSRIAPTVLEQQHQHVEEEGERVGSLLRGMIEPHDMFLVHVVRDPATAAQIIGAAMEGMAIHARIVAERALARSQGGPRM